MALPTLIVEFAPASTQLATSPTWVDITTYVLELNIERGFGDELDTVAEAGTATIVLDNRDRRFDPTYAAGPYFGNLKAGKQVRVRATYNSITYDLFRGHIERYPQTYPDQVFVTESALVCVDGTQWLSQTVIENDQVLSDPGRVVKPRSRRKSWYRPEKVPVAVELSQYADLIQYHDPWAYWNVAERNNETVKDMVGDKHLVPKNGASTSVTDLVIGEDYPNGSMFFERANSHYYRTVGLEVPEAKRWTVEALVELATLPSAAGIEMRIVTGPLDTGGTLPIFGLELTTTNFLRGRVYLSNNTQYLATATTNALTVGPTYHVAMIFDSGAARIKSYVDGAEVASTITGASLKLDPTDRNNIWIGGHPDLGTPGYFDGHIDEIAIYNQVLTPTTLLTRIMTFDLGFAMGDGSMDRIGFILDEVGWPATWRDTNEVASKLLTGRRYSNQSALEEIQATQAAEFGRTFISGNGFVTSYERAWRDHADFSSSAATFGDASGEMPYVAIGEVDQPDKHIYNHVMAKSAVGTATVMDMDTTSMSDHGTRHLDLGELILNSDTPAQDLCTDLVARYKDQESRFSDIVIQPAMDETNLWPKALGYDLCKHITIKKRPKGGSDTAITQASHIERISHHIPRGGYAASVADWTTTWTVSPR